MDQATVRTRPCLRDFRNKLAAHLSYLQQVGISKLGPALKKIVGLDAKEED
jgi:hypothetical protein